MTLSSRRAQPDLHACAERGYLGTVGDFNFSQLFLREPSTRPLLESLIETSAVPRAIEDGQFAVDSTGFSTVVYDRWFDQTVLVWLPAPVPSTRTHDDGTLTTASTIMHV